MSEQTNVIDCPECESDRVALTNIYESAARAAAKKYGGYDAARVELGRQRNQNSWGTFSYAFGNAVVQALDSLHTRGEL